jgi:hypothetical protein
MSEMSVSPAAILAESERFTDIADSARRIKEDLADKLAGLGPIAGDDKFGHEFDRQFNPAVESAHTVLEGVRDGMEQTTDRLQVTAALYTRSDDVNTDLGVHLY